MLCGIAQTAMPGARARFPFLLLVVALCVTGCREQGDIRIRSLHFNGVHRIDENALKGAPVTKQGSKLPWGHKPYFDRRAFESDLERIRAFYLDRGFPDARVQSFDVQLNAAQTEVSVVVNISEGEPVTVGTERGALTLPLVITDMPDAVVWLPTNSPGSTVRRSLGVPAGSLVTISAADGGAR